MQHLDEGTIHAWLDGALPSDEGAQVEAHAAECAACAAAVAEARGFIAGASRILTALDDVPGGVIPRRTEPGVAAALAKGRPAPRRRSWLTSGAMRAAAVIAFLAAGGVAVSRVAYDAREETASLASGPTSGSEPREMAATDSALASAATAPAAGAGAAATADAASEAPRALASKAPPPPAPTPAPSAVRRADESAAERRVARKAVSPEAANPESTALAFGATAEGARQELANAARDADRRRTAASAVDAAGARAGAVAGGPARAALADTAAPQSTAEAFAASPPPVDTVGAARAADQSSAQMSQAVAPAGDARPGARAETRARIVGVVTDAATGRPIPAARVQLRGLPLGAVTDSAGRYVIRDVPPGEHALSARMLGFTATQQSVAVDPNGTDEVNFAMRSAPVALSEAVVTGAGAARGQARKERAQSLRASGAPSAQPAAPAPPAAGDPARAFDGCYALSLSPWEPGGEAGEEARLAAVPSRVVLDAAPAGRSAAGGFRVLSTPGPSGNARQLATWSPLSPRGAAAPDSIVLTWPGGDGGIEMRLGRDGDRLRGTATIPGSPGRPVQRATVRATRVDCQRE
jgi:hypothetical protein